VAIRRVWIDDWQFQCCGEPFAIDSKVAWSTYRVTDPTWFNQFLDAEVASSITDHEQSHDLGDDRDLERTTGVVRAVHAVFCRYLEVDDVAMPIPGSGVLESRTSVGRSEPDDADTDDGRSFIGYLVSLDTAGA
jgi:hypothetical protein